MKKINWLRMLAVMMAVCMLLSVSVFAAEAEDAELEALMELLAEENTEMELLAAEEEKFMEIPYAVWTSEQLSLEDAVADVQAKGGGVVVVTGQDNILEENLTIPSGVTVLLPYNAPASVEEIVINAADHEKQPYANAASKDSKSAFSWPNDEDMMHQLTISEDTTLTVEAGGALILGGQFSSNNQGLGGQTYGAHSDIVLNEDAQIMVEGVLSTMGYITGSGEVRVNEDGEVYQPFVVTDYHGGVYTAVLFMTNKLTPFNSYTMPNIQCDMTIENGGNLFGYCDLYADNRHNTTFALIVGRENALLNVDGTVLFTYDDSYAVKEHFNIGKTIITVNGNASFGTLSMVIEYKRFVGSYEMTIPVKVHTKDVHFPMPYNLSYVQENGTLTVSNPVKILPGSEVYIRENAALKLTSELFVYDGYQSIAVDGGEVYPKGEELTESGLSERGHLLVDGEFLIEENAVFVGVVETFGKGIIETHDNADVSGTAVLVKEGVCKGEKFVSWTAGKTTKTGYDLIASVVDHDMEGSYLGLQPGKTYYAIDDHVTEVDGYGYYTYDDNGNRAAEAIIVPYTETITGTWSFLDVEVAVKNGEITAEFRNGDSTTPFVGSVMLASYNGDKQMQNVTMKTFAAEDHFSGVQKLDCSDLLDNDTTSIRVFLLDQNFVPMRAAQELELTAN